MSVDIVVIGASLGGLRALKIVLQGLPRAFAQPIVVVQHRGKMAHPGLAAVLEADSPLRLCEAEDKQLLVGGNVYIAPADYHLLVERGSLALSTEAPVRYARPSIDVLFASAAEAYGNGVVAVVLTGAGDDGARGCLTIKEHGGVIVVEDPISAESGAMPMAVLKVTPADYVVELSEIPGILVALCAA